MVNCPDNCEIYHKPVNKINNYVIYDCTFCDHRFVKIEKEPEHVTANYGDTYFFSGESGGYPDYLKESEVLFQRGKKYAEILKKIGIKEGNLLDVGSAAGFILKGFISEGWNGEGIEPNLTMVNYARNELGLNVSQASLEQFESAIKYDCVIMIQVMAHFYDLEKVISKLNSLLDDGKYLLIETWDRKSITAKVLGWKWHEYSPPTVIHWFSAKSLIKMFEKNNFSLVKKGRLFKKINVDHARTLLSEKFKSKLLFKLLKLIPDKMNFIYPSEDLFYIILKKKANKSKVYNF